MSTGDTFLNLKKFVSDKSLRQFGGVIDPSCVTSASPGGPRLPLNSASNVGGGHRDRQSQHATTSEAHTNSNGGAVPRRNVRKSDDH